MSRMRDEINRPDAQVCAGIDVGKSMLDICIHPSTDKRQFKNDAADIRSLVRQCQRHDVQLIVLEATGRYHCLAHWMLHEAGLAVAVINPYRSRKFADVLGQLAKSNQIDAEILARLAALIRIVGVALGEDWQRR